ncbi:hypothetical protein K2Z83_25165 [Oscillochloris sp. ZM17-4]|uniref:hypothetical protein n=1 Tax=Oscillochloris sp. ZM17-4 TaxID=2866714 RepID=UPI001C73C527|nr:hypothetical protein [Oscillochloris sp. ZM17-4]MBX0330952.1 hypothetical protein [Oscillochloris sp. ZM17-4]
MPTAAGAAVAQAVGASPARKLLIPVPAEGWDWAGVEPQSDDAIIGQIVRAVRQVLGGEPILPARTIPPLAIVGAIIGGILLLIVVLIMASVFINLVV